jgi:hypothetical protein
MDITQQDSGNSIANIMRHCDEGIMEINTAPLSGHKVTELSFNDIDGIDRFLRAQEEGVDISNSVTVIEDNAALFSFIGNNCLFVENCITCEHSETTENGNDVILPSGCKKDTPVQPNFPRYCEQFKQFS